MSEDYPVRKFIPKLCLVACAALIWAGAAMAQAEQTPAMAAEDIDRELIVRFSRAYGMAHGALKKRDEAADEVALEQPDSMTDGLSEEIAQIMAQNGITQEEWQGLMARMEEDEAFRQRVESLSTPFRYH
jgi:hypothetical protein